MRNTCEIYGINSQRSKKKFFLRLSFHMIHTLEKNFVLLSNNRHQKIKICSLAMLVT